MANQQLQTILQKEVSRKEFLGIAALALISILGFGHIMQLLTGKSLEHHSVGDGYGDAAYGGAKKGRL